MVLTRKATAHPSVSPLAGRTSTSMKHFRIDTFTNSALILTYLSCFHDQDALVIYTLPSFAAVHNASIPNNGLASLS